MKEATRTVVVTGVEMFQKTLDQGMAGDNVAACYEEWSAARSSEGRC